MKFCFCYGGGWLIGGEVMYCCGMKCVSIWWWLFVDCNVVGCFCFGFCDIGDEYLVCCCGMVYVI